MRLPIWGNTTGAMQIRTSKYLLWDGILTHENQILANCLIKSVDSGTQETIILFGNKTDNSEKATYLLLYQTMFL